MGVEKKREREDERERRREREENRCISMVNVKNRCKVMIVRSM